MPRLVNAEWVCYVYNSQYFLHRLVNLPACRHLHRIATTKPAMTDTAKPHVFDATAATLRRFCSDDTSLVVITDDSNITEELLKERFELSKTDILLPVAEEKRMYRESVLPLKSASAGILSVNGAAGVIAALNIARRVRDVVNTCLLLRAAGVFISLLFLLYFTVTGSSINVWQALAMQFLWAVPSVLSIFARKLG